jgi:hypothetical protein
MKYSGKETKDIAEKYTSYFTISISCGVVTPVERTLLMHVYWLTGEALRYYQSHFCNDPNIKTDGGVVDALERKFLDARKRQENDVRWNNITYRHVQSDLRMSQNIYTEEAIIASIFERVHSLRNVMSGPISDGMIYSPVREALKGVEHYSADLKMIDPMHPRESLDNCKSSLTATALEVDRLLLERYSRSSMIIRLDQDYRQCEIDDEPFDEGG